MFRVLLGWINAVRRWQDEHRPLAITETQRPSRESQEMGDWEWRDAQGQLIERGRGGIMV